jgi:hypothetical protein
MSIDPEAELQLEHHRRIQTELTCLVQRHYLSRIRNPEDFINSIISLEEVHIVTSTENYAARRARGDYKQARIQLVHFDTLCIEDQRRLWRRMLKGRVVNHADFNPDNNKPNKIVVATAGSAPV